MNAKHCPLHCSKVLSAVIFSMAWLIGLEQLNLMPLLLMNNIMWVNELQHGLLITEPESIKSLSISCSQCMP